MPAIHPIGAAVRRSPRKALALTTLAVALAVPATAGAADAHRYEQRNLVSDVPGAAAITDPHLVNAWGMAAGPQTPLWVNDNGTDLSTIYPRGGGGSPPVIAPLAVSIPGGAPTGIVFNGGSQFTLPGTGPARFIFDAESGDITAWNPGLSPITQAVRVGG